MDLTGIIFVALAVAWAGYLIPKALKHHDEVARSRSIDRFSTAMRVLARREPVNRRDARLVVTPPRPTGMPRVLVPQAVAAAKPPVAVPVAVSATAPASRAAGRAAARRRRHLLLLLLGADLVVAGLAWFAIVAWWSVAIPGGLTVAYLVLCRSQARRADTASWSRGVPGVTDDAELAPHRTIMVETPYADVLEARNAQGFEEISPDEDTAAIPVAALREALGIETETVAVSVATVDGGSLWDPLPVTLPTYVGKQRAARTVRTIDLTEPGTWSSGRSDADTKLVEDAAASAGEATDDQHAVGS